MTIREAAALLGVPYGRVYQAVRHGRVRARYLWSGWDVDPSSVEDLRGRWETEALIAETMRLIADANACIARRAQEAEAERRRPIVEAEKAERERERVRQSREKQAARIKQRRTADRYRLSAARNATEYAVASIMATEDQRGRTILRVLTLCPGRDPFAKVTTEHVADLPTFIKGLDR